MYLAATTQWGATLAPGVSYHFIWSGLAPWAVHLVQIDLARCELGFGVAGPIGRVSELVAALEAPEVLVAVNGDFFTPEGRPLGLELSGGSIRGRAGRPVFAWRPGTSAWIGTPRLEGGSYEVGAWEARVGEAGIVVGGQPELMRSGVVVDEVLAESDFANARHPRTAVGFDSERVWLVVVDGRRGGYSAGMSLPELAGLFAALGAQEALNLDGGGSSSMVVGRTLANRPSDEGGERRVVNALYLHRDRSLCGPDVLP